jgi:hypothetical protein
MFALMLALALADDADPFAEFDQGAQAPDSLVEQIRSSPAHRIDILEKAARSREHGLTASLRDKYRGHAAKDKHPTIYAIESSLDDETWRIDTRMGLVFTNTGTEGLKTLTFRLFPAAFDGDVNVKVVQTTDRGTRFMVDGTVLNVELGRRLEPGERLRLYMELDQGIPAYPEAGVIPTKVNAANTAAYGHGEREVNLGYWLPLLTHLENNEFESRPLSEHGEHAWHDPATFHVTLEFPEKATAAATGTKVSERTDGARKTALWTASGVREFAVHLGIDRQITEGEVDGITVRVHHPVGDPAAKELLDVAMGALALFQDRFGPYRYRELDIARTNVRVALGTEYPGMVTVDANLPADEATWTVAHEVAHQWWYSEVGNDPLAAPWIDEALTSYSASLYMASTVDGKTAEKRLYDGLTEGCQAMYNDRVLDLPADLSGDKYNLWNYGTVVYSRGAVFWHKVNQMLGDEAFFEATKEHYRKNVGKSVNGEQLIKPFWERAEKKSELDDLITRWILEAHCYEDVLGKSPKKLEKVMHEFGASPKGAP